VRKIVRFNGGVYDWETAEVTALVTWPLVERVRLAKAKVIEELLEVEDSALNGSSQDVLNELGDLLEAVFTLGSAFGWSAGAIETSRQEKSKRKGPMTLVYHVEGKEQQ